MVNKIWEVSELNDFIGINLNKLSKEVLGNIWLSGEAGKINQKIYGRGLMFFDLIDKFSIIKIKMYDAEEKINLLNLNGNFKSGVRINIFGKIESDSIRRRQGQSKSEYSFNASKIELASGIGDLERQKEEIKLRLQNEGFFADDLKKEIPKLPKIIGVITSQDSDALKDFETIVRKKEISTSIVVYHSNVQGYNAEKNLIAGIEYFEFEAMQCPEVIVITRGGGSREDLWCFNSEKLARRIASCCIPIISAIGHEKDHTICDLVADIRAATPTQAGNIVIKYNKNELINENNRLIQLMNDNIENIIIRKNHDLNKFIQIINEIKNNLREELDFLFEKLKDFMNKLTPKIFVELQEFLVKIENYYFKYFIEKKNYLSLLYEKLNFLDVNNILYRGFSILTDKKSRKIISSCKNIVPGSCIEATLQDGKLNLKVLP